jgi:hypothetical protein
MPNLVKNVDEMTLSEYVIGTFDRFCDLTEGRLYTLNKLMRAYNGHAINVGQFKEVFGLNGFFSILEYIGNMDNFDTLVNYGNMCLVDYEAQLESVNLSNGLKM